MTTATETEVPETTAPIEHQNDQATAEQMPAEPVTHLAKCSECAEAVKFQPNGSGSSFIVLDTETSYGISANGLPLCPAGHGEMTVADDQLPVEDAFALAAERLQQPQQASLPGIVPPFNYQGAYLELEEKALEVDRLHRAYVDAAAEAKDAKKAWDKAAETYTKMALELRRRRREKVEQGQAVTDLDTSRCTFQQLNPDVTCPVCSPTEPLPFAAAPKDSAEHAQQAEGLLIDRDVVDVEEALEAVGFFIARDTIRGWTADERQAVKAYAVATFENVDATFENVDPLPERPSVLGKNHVAGPEREGEPQVCTICDAVIAAADGETYPEDALVGVDCPGKPVEEHRYPTNKGRKSKASAKKK